MLQVISSGIASEPLDIAAVIAEGSSPSSGGVAVFLGTVRESAAVAGNRAKPVTRLDYEAHPQLAPRRMEEICSEAAAKWQLNDVIALHRSGVCELGEPTVVVVCGAAHRGDALEACRYIIEEIKATVPIWKKEVYADGSSWVGAEGGRP
ncbi:MAG: molybdenum cofactor biosynthesis protein MoaE [Actinomycetota bacterium]|nr:molybdenum cofactor biosynthesis protein MoaE [Actinomycetota bacterium]